MLIKDITDQFIIKNINEFEISTEELEKFKTSEELSVHINVLYKKKWGDFNLIYLETRNKLKKIIFDLFNTHEFLTKNIIKKEFKKMGIAYIKSDINVLIDEYQEDYTKKITEIITNIYNNSENISLKIIRKEIEEVGFKYEKENVNYILQILQENDESEEEIEEIKHKSLKKTIINDPIWKNLLPQNKIFLRKTKSGDFTSLYDGKNFIGRDGKKFNTLNKLNIHYEKELGCKNPGKINPWDRFMYRGNSIKKYYK